MLVIYTDFGIGPYTGQVKAMLCRQAPGVPVIDLACDAPSCNPQAAAYLLAALLVPIPHDAVVMGVVDPGVGNSDRKPVIVNVDGRWFVGPDNGLFSVVAMRGRKVGCWDVEWLPEQLSATFHGRDLFAPLAARLACGGDPSGQERRPADLVGNDWPADLHQIIYIDHFGNAVTGVRASSVAASARVSVGGITLPRARTFSDVPAGSGFCYKNAFGLLEIAVNRGRADAVLSVGIGDAVDVMDQAACSAKSSRNE
ncbi:MAG: hypothetical protein FD165_30 [Gammaproteobacteria bacterium]|nr:MAG: hypothetical protein FD165_30 [Gammaproteobacteria bacterium]TND06608.1 MAG: hypothetical protein FD120_340 [Gammaproteobacteria bacterium]